jgi:hypothetical protein
VNPGRTTLSLVAQGYTLGWWRRLAQSSRESGCAETFVLAELEPRQAELLELVRDHCARLLG